MIMKKDNCFVIHEGYKILCYLMRQYNMYLADNARIMSAKGSNKNFKWWKFYGIELIVFQITRRARVLKNNNIKCTSLARFCLPYAIFMKFLSCRRNLFFFPFTKKLLKFQVIIGTE